jgi:hypothetical protein
MRRVLSNLWTSQFSTGTTNWGCLGTVGANRGLASSGQACSSRYVSLNGITCNARTANPTVLSVTKLVFDTHASLYPMPQVLSGCVLFSTKQCCHSWFEWREQLCWRVFEQHHNSSSLWRGLLVAIQMGAAQRRLRRNERSIRWSPKWLFGTAYHWTAVMGFLLYFPQTTQSGCIVSIDDSRFNCLCIMGFLVSVIAPSSNWAIGFDRDVETRHRAGKGALPQEFVDSYLYSRKTESPRLACSNLDVFDLLSCGMNWMRQSHKVQLKESFDSACATIEVLQQEATSCKVEQVCLFIRITCFQVTSCFASARSKCRHMSCNYRVDFHTCIHLTDSTKLGRLHCFVGMVIGNSPRSKSIWRWWWRRQEPRLSALPCNAKCACKNWIWRCRGSKPKSPHYPSKAQFSEQLRPGN